MSVLSSGFDFAFFVSFILGVILFVLSLFIREEIHPDNAGGSSPELSGMV